MSQHRVCRECGNDEFVLEPSNIVGRVVKLDDLDNVVREIMQSNFVCTDCGEVHSADQLVSAEGYDAEMSTWRHP